MDNLPEDFEYVDASTNEEIIAACCNAMYSVDGIDTELMSNADKLRVLRIKRKSLRMISACIDEMYSLMFEDED